MVLWLGLPVICRPFELRALACFSGELVLESVRSLVVLLAGSGLLSATRGLVWVGAAVGGDRVVVFGNARAVYLVAVHIYVT